MARSLHKLSGFWSLEVRVNKDSSLRDETTLIPVAWDGCRNDDLVWSLEALKRLAAARLANGECWSKLELLPNEPCDQSAARDL